MATDAPTQSDDDGPDMSPAAVAERMEAGPLEILVMPADDNPALPPEVWRQPPPGYALPE
jgi:hypothetical protein